MKSSRLPLLCALWILFTASSNSIAMAYSFKLIQYARSTWHKDFLTGLLMSGLLSGIGQWVLLETKLKGTWMWILINILSIPLGLSLGNYLHSSLELTISYQLVVTSIAGMLLGVLQWLVLKNKIRSAYWWIPVSVLSWNIGLNIAYKIPGLFTPLMWNYSWNISGAIYGLAVGGIVGMLGSITIGKMLANYQAEIPHFGRQAVG